MGTDKHFAQIPVTGASQFKRKSDQNNRTVSIKSDCTIEVSSDDSDQIDDLYKNNGTEDTKSLEDDPIFGDAQGIGSKVKVKVNPLRLSGRQLLKPQMSPNSYDSDDERKIFSKEKDNFLFNSRGREGGAGTRAFEGYGYDNYDAVED